ncbi:MAG: peptide chain release factor N(5)-glutamine methyltransferase [Burkholderiales bacterium]|nr:peptide chain release factor N(5)-glutamine methyltransferase [Burkholderiales bacterium]
MTNLAQLLAQSELPLLEARMLLERVLGKNRAWLIAHADEAADAEAQQAFAGLAQRRREGEPMAYILGVREFYGLDFGITPAVLIPRPETELLVELALERIPANTPVRVLDLGTGSGVIAVALARERPQARVTAVDVDYAALTVARANAKRHKTTVRFFCGDWFGALAGEKFDLVVSNPPYIAAEDPHLGMGDLGFEPQRALVGGNDGLDCIRVIVAKAGAHLNPGAWLLFEHGYDQSEACRALLEAQSFCEVRSWPDFAGIPRVSGGCIAGMT